MKGIPRSKGLLVIALIVAMITVGGIPVTVTSFAADDTSSCGIGLSKEANNTGINEWEITLKVKGNEVGRSSDVVIVMDRSRSMSYYDNTSYTRIERAKCAANEFVKQVLDVGNNARIAVITFDKTAKTIQGFTNNRKTLNDSINSIDANYIGQPSSAGGTNLQAGLHKTDKLLAESTADVKSVVLISDGAPTHSYQFTGSVDVALRSCQIADGIHSPEWATSSIDEAYDYNNIVGYGNNFQLTDYTFTYSQECIEDSSVTHTFGYPENHGIPAIYEADLLKSKGDNIYAIGIGVVEDGKDVLKKCENSGYCDIKTCDTVYDFSGIAAAIDSEAFNAVVTDPIGAEFDLVTEVKVSKGSVSYSSSSALITWDIGKLKPYDTATMTYRVKAKAGIIFENGDNNIYPTFGNHLTNGDAAVRYQYPEGDPLTSSFNKPEVPLTGGAVQLKAIAVDKNGQPVDSSGNPTTTNGALLLDEGRFPVDENQFMVYGLCQVSTGAIIESGGSHYSYRGYSCMNSDGSQGISSNDPSDLEADVDLTPENGLQTVYFMYLKGETPQPKYHDVTVRYIEYVGESEVSIHPNKTYSATEGAVVTETAEIFDDYTLISDESSITRTVKDPEQDANNNIITFVYKHNESKYYNVRIRYVTIVDGGQVSISSDGAIENKAVGTEVSATAITIKDYEISGPAIQYWSVIKPTTDPPAENTITFVYKPVSTIPTDGEDGGGGGGGDIKNTVVSPPTLNKTDHFAYVIGYPDGEVKPLGTITREEVAVIFYRLMAEESRKAYASTTQPFSDVSSKHWSNVEIATLYNAKIIQGNSNGSFMPGKPITRAEFAAIAAKFDKLEDTNENKFPDIENHWAKDYINSSAEKGWINGYGDGTFRPDHIIIRCEAMKLINEVLDRRVNIAGLHKDTKQWPDNTEDKWYYEIVLEATNTHDYERENKPKSIEKWTKIRANPVW